MSRFEDALDAAERYLAGQMDQAEQLATEALLRAGDQTLRDAVARLSFGADRLADCVPAISPAEDLRRRVFSALRREQRQPDGTYVIRAADAEWIDFAPGITMLTLWRDPGSPRLMQLFRCQPGARLPAHNHDGPEEAFVLEGDITFGQVELHAGDYQRADEFNRHGEAVTKGGCLLLLSSPG